MLDRMASLRNDVSRETGQQVVLGYDAPRGLRVEIVPGDSHFLHQERPEAVNRALLDFLVS